MKVFQRGTKINWTPLHFIKQILNSEYRNNRRGSRLIVLHHNKDWFTYKHTIILYIKTSNSTKQLDLTFFSAVSSAYHRPLDLEFGFACTATILRLSRNQSPEELLFRDLQLWTKLVLHSPAQTLHWSQTQTRSCKEHIVW